MNRPINGFTLVEVVLSFTLMMILISVAYPIMRSGMAAHSEMLQKEEALRLGMMYIDQARSGTIGDSYREEWQGVIYQIGLNQYLLEEHLKSIEVTVTWQGTNNRKQTLTLGTMQFVPPPPEPEPK
jgi:type II secretory pathway pseudopilin PulG